jgi:hypothetical protein
MRDRCLGVGVLRVGVFISSVWLPLLLAVAKLVWRSELGTLWLHIRVRAAVVRVRLSMSFVSVLLKRGRCGCIYLEGADTRHHQDHVFT